MKHALPAWLIITLVHAIFALSATAVPHADIPVYRLTLGFDLKQHLLHATAQIEVPAGRPLVLDTKDLTITGTTLKRQGGDATAQELVTPGRIFVPAGNNDGELSVAYSYRAEASPDNRISHREIALLSGWYPQPHEKMRYQLSAELPTDFTAITEADTFPLKRAGSMVTSRFSQPLTGPHFLAAPYSVDTLPVREGLTAYTLFFPEDRQLAADYLFRVRDYLLRYEASIGPYPYNHFAVVANRQPTGLGMPTFTLLGQAVLRLPFITDTSLGHEVLHSWFGNWVSVAPGSGNWCEGLTAYLSDYAYRQDKGEGTSYRHETLTNYLSYVHEDNAIPLAAFTDASHSQPDARARRAVGYGRGVLFFHELHERLGHERFMAAIRSFVSRHGAGEASWLDLQQVVVEVAEDEELPAFFHERLNRTDMPAISARDIEVRQHPEGLTLDFTLLQETTAPYTLRVPVTIKYADGNTNVVISSREQETAVSLPIASRPLQIILDEELSLFRRLTPDEQRPTWSRFIGSTQQLVVLANENERRRYQPLLDTFGLKEQIRVSSEVANSELAGSDLLLLGLDQLPVANLFGRPLHEAEGFTLDVRANPLAPGRVAVLVSSSSRQETEAIAPRLSHYGKYGFLSFTGGRPRDRQLPAPGNGIRYLLEQLPAGIATTRLDPFASLVAELAQQDVIYIGEMHTSASDHLLQLRLLEALATQGTPLAIGMEMFPAASQAALDRYILAEPGGSERDFLKESKYFDVWQYDYRYYREILQFARKQKIPVIGLNLERDIVSSVYRHGSTDQLSPSQRKSLVRERDLTLPGYGERLLFMHGLHLQGGHGDGQASGFIQAQALWDETMAAAIAHQISTVPSRKLIVLAGNEHTRKDSGIPPRVARRVQVQQATVYNISGGSPPQNSRDVADYLFFSDTVELPPSLLMGITLREEEKSGSPTLVITGFTDTSQADEAGLKAGDRVQRIDGFPVTTMGDVRIGMTTRRQHDRVMVHIERDQDSGPVSHMFEVMLSENSPANPHR